MRRYALRVGIGLTVIALIIVVVVVVIIGLPNIPFLGRATLSPEELLAELEPLPPIVADRLPQRGVELLTNGDIDIFFDQPMDQQATNNAFTINPPVAGSFVWLDADTLRFTPSQALERATRYTVTITENALSANGLQVREPIILEFQTVGFLEVSQVVPAPGSLAVEPQSVITVMFNRPVVPLLIVEEQDGLPQPLRLDPQVAGRGEWLNTSIYQFRPDVALAGGVTYQASIAPGLEDTTGGLMVEGFTWEFVTVPPGIIEVSPQSGADEEALDSEIRVTFNQPMDVESTQSALAVQSIAPGGGVVSGQFEWDENTLIFRPNSLLELATDYVIRVEGSALSASRQTGLGQQTDWGFRTVGPPAIIASRPVNGVTNADPDRNLRIEFATPMDEDTLKRAGDYQPHAAR